MTPATLLLAATLLVHDWYPRECCSDTDCRPIPCTEIINDTWQGHKFNSHRPSQDARCHICVYQPQGYISPRYLCLFTPEASS
jgi:hypothetical protein